MALRWHRKRILAGLPASISHPANRASVPGSFHRDYLIPPGGG
jgi:hypothetical protein